MCTCTNTVGSMVRRGTVSLDKEQSRRLHNEQQKLQESCMRSRLVYFVERSFVPPFCRHTKTVCKPTSVVFDL